MFLFSCQVATDVIKEFAADGVKYLELRSTPREERDTGEWQAKVNDTQYREQWVLLSFSALYTYDCRGKKTNDLVIKFNN